MKLIKCPRCDLNYIQENEKLCKVCQRELKGSQVEDEMELCSVCNAAPALPGRDVCLSCLKEMASGGSGTVALHNAVLSDLTEQIEILLHGRINIFSTRRCPRSR